ncbi:Membrane-bound lytic murein transglycosylase F [wastewater metagenome]|uniref:Membrane-bound lytic murein transglycosylase F n=2 Tax=unclassified sequences TaxID=12908 RepID=A0A5B8RB88_9ZZZZ|nr:membrane-bound lytic murein transglycosylase F [uncultured organism]
MTGFRGGVLAAALLFALLLAVTLPLSGQGSGPRSLAAIRASGELVVLTRNAPTTYYIGRDGRPTGPEHDLVEAFAEHLGVSVRYRVAPTVDAVIEGMAAGGADLAAAGLTITGPRRERFRFGPPYQPVTQQVVCRRDNVQPESVADLAGLDLVVIANSSYVQRLRALKADGHPDLDWRTTEAVDTETLLARVWRREIDCTVADSNIVDINRRYYPELIAPFNLSREQHLGWLMPAGAEALDQAVSDWLDDFRAQEGLALIRDRYYGFFQVFDYVDIARYVRRIDERYPRFRAFFREAAGRYDLPPLLLAAQAYQESHWRADARSPTGVRGIMMLTRSTARAMGVKDRLDPEQSIMGGAKYLARMKTRFDDGVEEPDRTWLALAAYNVGRGHVHDAQVLARQRGLDPHRWHDIKQVLPLLADKRYYRDLNHGYARGTEPVRYVGRIREYLHVLRARLTDGNGMGPGAG